MSKRRRNGAAKNTGKPFEEAVARFVQALDPKAVVTRNYFGRDRDTKERQQMDVWVRATLFGHLPATILISCKDHKRILDAGHIRTFVAEWKDSGASMGIIYSSRGFNDHALAKAKANGVICCRLFQNQPGELPESFTLTSFLSSSRATRPFVSYEPGRGLESLTWERLLTEPVIADDRTGTALDMIDAVYRKSELWAIEQLPKGKVFPPSWISEFSVLHPSSTAPIRISVNGTWRRYRGLREAHLLNGSYCLSNNNYRGEIASPVIDTWSEHPGDGWEEVFEDLDRPSGISVLACRIGPRIKDGLLKAMVGPLISAELLP